MFRRRGGFGLRMKSLPKEGETVSGQTTAVLTAPAESTEEGHLVRYTSGGVVALKGFESCTLRRGALVVPRL